MHAYFSVSSHIPFKPTLNLSLSLLVRGSAAICLVLLHLVIGVRFEIGIAQTVFFLRLG